MAPALLEVANLTVRLPTDAGNRAVIRDITFQLAPGEALGLVGESGSGKSMTAKAIDRLLPDGAVVEGSIRVLGQDVAGTTLRDERAFRRNVAMIFQDPRAHINPVRRIGDFMTESLRLVEKVSKREAWSRAELALGEVGIDRGRYRLEQYPHQLSGGMLQRVMIATALLTEPQLLIADEPTTALDATTQAEVVAILNELRSETGLALIFITHDLDLASAICDRTAVMYAGQIVELNVSERLHVDALHPYTAALAAARPDVARTRARLPAIPGAPLSAFEAPDVGCAFAARCAHVIDACREQTVEPVAVGSGTSLCIRTLELHGKLGAIADG